jgi:signal transduction histidine kinase
VSVEDSGSGIPTDEAPLIFEAFHSTREAGDGRGLALAVSKATLEACSGSLVFTSIPGKTIFTATFPASAARNGCPDPGPDW